MSKALRTKTPHIRILVYHYRRNLDAKMLPINKPRYKQEPKIPNLRLSIFMSCLMLTEAAGKLP